MSMIQIYWFTHESNHFVLVILTKLANPSNWKPTKFECYSYITTTTAILLNDALSFVNNTGFFLTKIFHPNVAQNGAICVNTLKRDWKPEHGIKHILLVSLQGTLNCVLVGYRLHVRNVLLGGGHIWGSGYDPHSGHVTLCTKASHATPVVSWLWL